MLPSQSARSSSSRSHMYRRTRKRRAPLIVGSIVILVGTAVVFKWVYGSSDPTQVSAVTPAVNPVMMEAPPASSPTPREQTRSVPRTEPAATQTAQRSSETPANVTLPPPVTKPVDRISMGGSMPSQQSATQTQPTTQATNPLPNNPPATTLAAAPAAAPELPRSTIPTAPSATSSTTAANTPASQRMQAGMALLSQNKPVEARRMLTSALLSPGLSGSDAERVRQELTRVNQRLVFSPEIAPGDPFASHYSIEAGDSLARLPRKLGLKVDWRFLQRINNISAPQRIQVGQRIKVVKGPFHAIVHKAEYRMDLFMGDGPERVYVRSFRVGLGEHGATPEGVYIVKPTSKLINPAWTNPRTGEFFAADDPLNPLGEYWIGLIGISDNIRGLETYGIHGTIEPDSIGQSRSMGCVRMLHDDVALTYELLIENVSQVEIHGDDYP
jgi:hypothetical protein